MVRHFGSVLAVMMLLAVSPGEARAQGIFGSIADFFTGGLGDGNGSELRATIWVDPDGCEHWVMDDGLEGFMSSHLDKDGNPVCRSSTEGNGVCKTFESSTMFAVGSARLKKSSRAALEEYFESIRGASIFVNGHTDATGGDQANLQLSLQRAIAVAEVAKDFGVNAEPRGFGEQVPAATNDTAAGRAKNRRVELTCS